MREQWQVLEIVNADGFPIRVVALRVHDPLPRLKQGETIRWLAAAVPISGDAARRLTRMRLKMIGQWYGSQPPWLRQRVPQASGDSPPRAVCRTCDGRIEHFSSISAAALAVGRSRKWVHMRIIDGLADFSGCRWSDATGSVIAEHTTA
jgi:hypothetical protein